MPHSPIKIKRMAAISMWAMMNILENFILNSQFKDIYKQEWVSTSLAFLFFNVLSCGDSVFVK